MSLSRTVGRARSVDGGRLTNATPIPSERWMVPGTDAFRLLVPDIEHSYRCGEMSEAESHQAASIRIKAVLSHLCAPYEPRYGELLEDMAQELHIRVARMDFVKTYDPQRGTPTALLIGIARNVLRDLLRRQRFSSTTVSLEVIKEPVDSGSQLQKAIWREGAIT